jgi:sugar phosphate isomerase/epimerase
MTCADGSPADDTPATGLLRLVVFEPITLSLALAQTPEAASPRAALVWAREHGFAWVQLDATQRGVRPRELGGSARRDLAATASRTGIRMSGLDLWVPPEHFLGSDTVDRAVSAVVDAAGLLGDLVQLGAAPMGAPVSILLPDGVTASVVAAIEAAADKAGVLIADHAVEPATGAGVDPALHLMAGGDPTQAVSGGGSGIAIGHGLAAVRLSDANAIGRCAVGSGKLDVLSYAVALSTAEWGRTVTVDVRGLPDPEVGVARAVEAWRDSTSMPSDFR